MLAIEPQGSSSSPLIHRLILRAKSGPLSFRIRRCPPPQSIPIQSLEPIHARRRRRDPHCRRRLDRRPPPRPPTRRRPTHRLPARRPAASPRDPNPLVPLRPHPRPRPRLQPRRARPRRHLPRRRSRLYRRLLLPDSPLRRRLGLLAPARLSVLGVGSFEASPAARLQLALAALLRRDLLPDSASADLFDPVLSAVECAAAAELGFSVPSLDDGCRRRVEGPTLFYMPHCEASLYDALLAANWDSPAQLRRVCVLGNSFQRYALQAEDNRSGPAAKSAHVLAAGQFAYEERVGETGDLDEDDWFARAFNETSWHFFEVDDGFDLASSIAGGRR